MSRIAAALIAILSVSGCSLRPGSYQSFDEWLVGEPERDYDDLGMKSVPGLQRVYGLVLTPPYAARDALRLGLAPLAFPYYAFTGEEESPAPR
jgi:hypothetical protein